MQQLEHYQRAKPPDSQEKAWSWIIEENIDKERKGRATKATSSLDPDD